MANHEYEAQTLAHYSLHEVAQAVGGECFGDDRIICGVSIDSRNIASGNLYVALSGERVDGHNYVANALSSGAVAAIVSRECENVSRETIILVDDCLEALQKLASHQRKRSKFRLVGITGSVGKTSTKEMLSIATCAQSKVFATAGNYNNHIGMPLTLVNAPDDADVVVLEMGMNHAGEINVLSTIAKPDVAIITNVEAVHLEFFESVEGIARAKAEIMDGMNAGSAIILPIDNQHYQILRQSAEAKQLRIVNFGKSAEADFRVKQIEVSPHGVVAELKINDADKTLKLSAIGEHLVQNAVAVLAAVDALGLDLDIAITALENFHEAKGRGDFQLVQLQKNPAVKVTILDETYNASPASMRASMNKLTAIAAGGRKIAVLGDMLELGENSAQFHADLYDILRGCGFSALFCVGSLMLNLHNACVNSGAVDSAHFTSNAELATALIDYLRDGDYVLFKGSRGAKIEEIIGLIK